MADQVEQTMMPIVMKDLANTKAELATPEDYAYDAMNATFVDDDVRGAARFGSQWKRAVVYNLMLLALYTPTAGGYRITDGVRTTADLAWNSNNAAIQAAIRAAAAGDPGWAAAEVTTFASTQKCLITFPVTTAQPHVSIINPAAGAFLSGFTSQPEVIHLAGGAPVSTTTKDQGFGVYHAVFGTKEEYIAVIRPAGVFDTQTVHLFGPSAGNYRLTDGTRTTADIAWNASHATIQAAIRAAAGGDPGWAGAFVAESTASSSAYLVTFPVTTSQPAISLTNPGAGAYLSGYTSTPTACRTTARAFTVNSTDGFQANANWGGLLVNGATHLYEGRWVWAQYEDWVYFFSPDDPSKKVYCRRVGGPLGALGDADYDYNDNFREFQPDFVRYVTSEVDTDRPEYPAYTFTYDAVLANTSKVTIWNIDPASGNHIIYPVDLNTGQGVVNTDGSARFKALSEPLNQFVNRFAVMVEVPAGVDLSDVGYIYFRVKRMHSTGPQTLRNSSNVYSYLAISEDVTALATLADFQTWIADSSKAKKAQELFLYQAGANDVSDFELCADIRNIADANKNAVRRFVFGFETTRDYGIIDSITGIRLGGQDIRDSIWLDTENVEYAFRYRDGTGLGLGGVTNAQGKVLKDDLWAGERLGPDPLPKMGSWPKVIPDYDANLFNQGYDTIQVFRRIANAEGQGTELLGTTGWVLIGTVNNVASATTRTVLDKYMESELRAIPTRYELAFGNTFAADINPDCVGIWKQSLALGYDREVYFSFESSPKTFMPPSRQMKRQPDPFDVTQGRTLYVSQGRFQRLYGVIGQDLCYLIGPGFVSVMVGEQAFDATPPRVIPRADGSLGRWAQDAWGNGVICASMTGLWYHEASRAAAISSDDTIFHSEELTKFIRTSWKTLLGSSATERANIIVKAFQDEIWVFCGNRYLHRTKTDLDGQTRRWEYGEMPLAGLSDTFVALTVDRTNQNRGLRAMTSAGRIVRLSTNYDYTEFTTDTKHDDGQYVAGSQAVTWWAKTGKKALDRRRVVGVYANAVGTPQLTVSVFDGKDTAAPVDYTVPHESGRIWALSVNVLPGLQHQFTVGGTTGSDKMEVLGVLTESEGPGYGN